MGQTALSVSNSTEESVVAAQAGSAYRLRRIPSDWFVDPADPGASEVHDQAVRASLGDAATAFLTAHEAESAAAPASVDHQLAEPVWIGFNPSAEDFSDEGELGWQTDALCAQTDPEAFFPEKGGSTRDAKKVCGACNVKAQCLEYALANDERFGIWGGLSERERRRLRKRAV